jgi:hypothetical protein
MIPRRDWLVCALVYVYVQEESEFGLMPSY